MTPTGNNPFDPILLWVQIQRGLAFLVDQLIITSLFSLTILLGFNFNNITLKYLSFFYLTIAPLVYSIIFETRMGQTIGKKLLGVRVYTDTGRHPSRQAIIKRNITKYIVLYILPIGWIITLAFLYLTEKKQGPGDLVAHTVVVNEHKLSQRS